MLRFPYPSTTAGLVRTRLGSNDEGVFVAKKRLDELREVGIRGPLLAHTGTCEIFVPAPRDCFLIQPKGGELSVRALHPLREETNALFDHELETVPVGLSQDEAISGKPLRDAPAWWPWDLFQRWLAVPEKVDGDTIITQGLRSLPVETRIHVKLGQTETAEEGMLFSSSGLRFVTDEISPTPLALALDVEAGSFVMRPGVTPAGG